MTKITLKKHIIMMCIIASSVYFTSYITRVNYNTVLVEISSDENILRSLLALPLTASFITYGLGQIISGCLGDRYDPFHLIFIGLAMSALMNILLPIFPSPYLMIIFWAVNGLAQALIYPPLMRIISHYLSELDYAKACLFVTIGGHIATLLMYLISPAAIVISGWKLVFFFSGGCAVVFLVIWQLYSMHIKKKYGSVLKCSKVDNKTRETSKNVSTKELFVSSGLLIIMLAVVMQGVLREGITAWMPAYLSDIFSLNNEISILTTVILPIFSIFSAYVILTIRTRLCKNELKLACITFFVAFASIVILLIVRTNMSLTVLLLALTSACAHAVNFLLICLVPVKFEKYSKFTLVTGVINSCTYVGAAISTYGVAAVSENFGWNVTLCLWGVIAFIGMICCSVILKHWNKA